MPAPANNAATPTAPVRIGANAPAVEPAPVPLALPDGAPDPEPEGEAAVAVGVVPAVKPEVKGAAVTDEAPEKAAVCEEAVGTGVAAVALGLRTWSMTWTTPLATRTLGITTLALLTKTVPLSMVMTRLGPAREVTCPFWRREE